MSKKFLMVVPAGLSSLSDLEEESALGAELQHLMVLPAFPAYPDVTLMVDEESVLDARPVVAGPGTTP